MPYLWKHVPINPSSAYRWHGMVTGSNIIYAWFRWLRQTFLFSFYSTPRIKVDFYINRRCTYMRNRGREACWFSWFMVLSMTFYRWLFGHQSSRPNRSPLSLFFHFKHQPFLRSYSGSTESVWMKKITYSTWTFHSFMIAWKSSNKLSTPEKWFIYFICRR